MKEDRKEVTDAAIALIKGAYGKGGLYKSQRDLALKLGLNAFAINQICSKKRKSIGVDIQKKLAEISGFREAMEMEKEYIVTLPPLDRIIQLQKLLEVELEKELQAPFDRRPRLEDKLKIERERLEAFSLNKEAFSLDQLACVFLALGEPKIEFPYERELEIARFTVNNFSCNAIQKPLDLVEDPKEFAHKITYYSSPVPNADFCCAEQGENICYYDKVDWEKSKKIQKVVVPFPRPLYAAFIHLDKEYLVLLKEKGQLGEVYLKGKASIDFSNESICFEVNSKPKETEILSLFEYVNKKVSEELESYSELESYIAKKEAEIGSAKYRIKDGQWIVTKTVGFNQVKSLYEKV